MGGNVDLTTQRAGTGRLGSLTGNLDPAAVQAATAGSTVTPTDPIQKKAKTDTLSLSPDTQSATAGMNVANVADLAKTVGAVQNEQKQVTDYQARINALIPGGVQFDTQKDGTWSSQDLKSLLEVVEAMSLTDRQVLSGIHVVRAGKVDLGKGGEASIGERMGSGIGEAAQTSALGSAVIDGPVDTGNSKLKDFVLHSAAVMQGIPVLRYFGNALKHLFGQTAPERAIVLGNSGSVIPKEVWVQEIGHQVQMVNRGWNPEKIAEFAKLSDWTEHDGNGQVYAADGVDHQTGMRMNFAPGVLQAGRQDNFVSKYAGSSPVEDFAESYKAFILDPKTLMQTAPDKFLYLNAQSQKYSPSEVRAFAQQTGQDLGAVATELVVHSTLTQQTLDALLSVNGVSADAGALRSDAAAHLSSGDPLSQAWAKIATDAQNPSTAQALIQDPATALGDLWSKLSPSEQAILKDPTFMQAQVGDLQKGYASTKSSADQTELVVQRQATSQFMDKLLNDASFQQALAANPASALKDAGLFDTLPSDVVAAFSQHPAAVGQLITTITQNYDAASAEDRARYDQNLKKALPLLGTEHFSAFASSLNNPKDPAAAAKQLMKAMESGSLVIQDAGGPPNT